MAVCLALPLVNHSITHLDFMLSLSLSSLTPKEKVTKQIFCAVYRNAELSTNAKRQS